MTEKQLYGNRLVAEFMDATKEQWYPANVDLKTTGIYYVYPKGEYPENQKYVGEGFLKYHIDYNWFMKAFKRFDDIRKDEWLRNGSDAEREFWVIKTNIASFVNVFDIDAAFDQLIEGIKWYNDKAKLHKIH